MQTIGSDHQPGSAQFERSIDEWLYQPGASGAASQDASGPGGSGAFGWDGGPQYLSAESTANPDAPIFTAQAVVAPKEGWFRRTWSNEKARHGLIAAAGILVVCVGVVLALLVGKSSQPAAETLGEALAHASDAYPVSTDTAVSRPSTTTPQTTAAPAEVSAPVGDTTTTASKSGSSSGSKSSNPDGDEDSSSSPSGSTLTCPSTDARCGAFRWQPAPAANQLLVVAASVTVGGAAVPNSGGTFVVPVGAELALTLTADDPDAAVSDGPCALTVTAWGDAEDDGCVAPDVVTVRKYGAQAPPDPVAGHFERTWPKTLEAGTYKVTFTAESGDLARCTIPGSDQPAELCNPYANQLAGEVTIVVE